METFTVRDLRERSGDLIRCAEEGKLSVVTKHGAPVFVAVPFDDILVREGVTVALAVHLFDEAQMSLSKAAQLAGMSRVEFTRHLSQLNIPVIRTDAAELERDLAAFNP
ncbi:MAG: type II toxin-antitoxin system prevent-host-death family antitoxin [Aquabacterium commune]|uniref:type II toxin-antitoxin system prevent-host-death family antitoxin n=1 Tax=Aquabacterium commune TaxID=70586 RepID=UPI00310B474A